MTTTGRLRAYNWTLDGWTRGKLTIQNIDLLARAGWITKDEAEQIKALPQNKEAP